MKKKKKLFKGVITKFVKAGCFIAYYRRAYSEKQAKVIIRKQFNKDYGFVPEAFVPMEIKEVKTAI